MIVLIIVIMCVFDTGSERKERSSGSPWCRRCSGKFDTWMFLMLSICAVENRVEMCSRALQVYIKEKTW